jgi:predicted RNase H-like nuclease (RuvC/YqgF family)
LTEGDAQRVLTKQAEAMAEYNTQIDQKKDAIEELQWKVEDLQEEVDTLKKVQDEKKVEAGKQLRENETRDMTVEEHYTQ